MSEILIKAFQYIFSRRWFYLFLVPVVLFLFALGFTIYHILTYDAYFTVMPVFQKMNAVSSTPQSDLIDGDVVKGEFQATMNNLGAVGIHIKDTHPSTVPDDFSVVFRIREKGSHKWYSANSYLGGQFHQLNLFPFGFPLIADSKGKTYEFELFTKGSDIYNAPTVKISQSVIGEYAFPKSELKHPQSALKYLEGKLAYLFHYPGGVLYILIYFLPLYTYFYLLAEKERIVIPFWFSFVLLMPVLRNILVRPAVECINFIYSLLYKCKIIDKYKPLKTVPTITILLILAIIIDIFFIDVTDNLLFTILFLLWGISIIVYKIQLQSSFLFAFGFLVLSLLLLLVRFDNFANQSAIWAYLFLVLGAVHAVVIVRLSKQLMIAHRNV